MKKVEIFKTTFPNGNTHYGVSEQVHTVESYLNKTKSIAVTKSKKDLNISNFQKDVVEFEKELKIELLFTFNSTSDAKYKRDELIKNDLNSINSQSANIQSKLNYTVSDLILPIEKSKSLKSANGTILYFVDISFAKKINILDRLNISKTYPSLSNLVMINEGSYKIIRK